MTYKQLKRTFDILSSHDSDGENGYVEMWAEHDEHGINYDISVLEDKDIIELAEMGWLWGCDEEGPSTEDFEEAGAYDGIKDIILNKEEYVRVVRESEPCGIYSYE